MMPQVGEVAHIEGGDESLDVRAKRLWEALVGEAERRRVPITKEKMGRGYLWSGSINQVVASIWTQYNDAGDPRTRSFISTLRSHLKANKNLDWNVEHGQLFVSAKYHEPKQKSKHSVLGIISTVAEASLVDRSHKVWAKAKAYAIQHKVVAEEFDDVLFYRVDKPLAYFINAEFPDLHHYEGGRQPIYDFLRSTANCVNIGRKHDDSMKEGEHVWLIRDEWSESGTNVIFRTIKQSDSIDRRAERLTPEEAGETREPAPVEIRRQAQKEATVATPTAPPEPANLPCPHEGCTFVGKNQNALNGHRASHGERQVSEKARDTGHRDTGHIVLPDGRVKCDECEATFNEAASIPGHKKMHYNERREAEIQRLQREVRGLRQKRLANDINLERDAALRIIIEAVEGSAHDAAQVAVLRDELTETKREVEELKQAGDTTVLLDLLQQIVDAVNSGTVAPIRGMADVDDLLRTMKKGK